MVGSEEVDAHRPGVHPAGHPLGLLLVGGEDDPAEAERRVVGQGHRLVHVAVAQHRDHGPEDLLPRHRHLRGDVGQDGGGHVEAGLPVGAAAAGDHPGTLRAGGLEVAHDHVVLGPVGQGPEDRALLERVALRGRRDGRPDHLDDLVVAALGGQDPGGDVAGLPGVAQAGAEEHGGHVLEVGVGQHDRGGLPAELQGHGLELLAARGGDPPAHRRGAGEGDLAHGRVPDQPVAHAAVAGDEVDHASGHPGGGQRVDDEAHGQRRGRGRLDHHGAPGEQGRGELGDHEVDREVPRGDEGAHPDGVLVHHGLPRPVGEGAHVLGLEPGGQGAK